MARGKTLAQLVSALKAETGESTLVSVGVGALPALQEKIRRTQEFLYDDYDWPHLKVFVSKTMTAGQRYYDIPTEINYERILKAVHWWNDEPTPIERGIGFDHYAQYHSDDDERADPVLAWDIRWRSTVEQIEVWPIPDSSGDTIQFEAIRKLRALTADSDVADIDDRLIVLTAAADILARQKAPGAGRIASMAAARYARLRGLTQADSPMVTFGGTDRPRKPRDHVIIRVS